MLLQLIFSGDMQETRKRAPVSDSDWEKMAAYASAVFVNCGNYKGYGDTKFIPEIEIDVFRKIMMASPNYQLYGREMEKILDSIEDIIWQEPGRIGFREENGGSNSFYSTNITKNEAKKVDEICQ